MEVPRKIVLLGFLTSFVFAFCPSLEAQNPRQPIDQFSQQPSLVLRHTRPFFADEKNLSGPVESGHRLRRMVLVLVPTAEQETELQQLLNDQQDKHSLNYHRWLPATEFGARFAPSDTDIEQVRTWLEGAGMHVERIALSRRWIEFSGTAGQVEYVFHTKMQYYQLQGKTYLANATDLTVPASLSGITRGVFSLNNFGRRPPARLRRGTAGTDGQGRKAILTPQLTAAGGLTNTYYLAPGDFAAIYGTKGLLSSGIDGRGVAIAVTAQSQIELTDVQQFRTIFGLKTNDPNILVTGPDPGIASQLDSQEALLDVEWAGAVAPGATIDLVVAESTDTTSGVDLAAAYAIDNEIAPILTYTYGACEQAIGTTGNAFYNALWQQAAAEGITVLVAAGDNGAAGCDNPNSGIPAQLGPAVNGVASTPYGVAVGGTQLNDSPQASTYWNTANAPDYSSAIGYIPEASWNESCDPVQMVSAINCAFGNTNLNLSASGGGPSTIYSKPSWQSGSGVPNDGARDLPDIALAAASAHDAFVYCTSLGGTLCQINAQQQVVGLTLVGGTSAATPAMAGILALVEQKNGTFQGQINYNLYRLAALPGNTCDSLAQTNPTAQNSCVFYDVSSGSNRVPCAGGSPGCSSMQSGMNGFLTANDAATGYDLVTGLGSVNATNLANAWMNVSFSPSQITLRASSLSATHGTPITLSGTVSSGGNAGTPTGFVSVRTDAYGDPPQMLALNNGGAFSSDFSNLPGGQYNLLAHYAGDPTFAASDSSVLPITITPEDSATNVIVNGLNSGGSEYDAALQVKVNVAGISGQGVATGSVQLLDNGSTIKASSLNSEGVVFIPTGGGGPYSFSPGAHALVAAYSGDNSFHPSTSSAFAFSISKGSPFVVVGVNEQTVPVGRIIGVHAVVAGSATAAATGSVQFTSDGTPCGAPVMLQTGGFFGSQAQASALLTGLAPGTHIIGATYNALADPNYLSVASGDPTHELTQLVTVGGNAGSATTTTLVVRPTPLNLGDTGTFLVIVSPMIATGTVTIWDAVGPRSAATVITSGTASIQFAWTQAGMASVYAVYSGDSANASSTSTPTAFAVLKGLPRVSLVAPTTTSAQQQVTLNVTVSGNPANPQLPFPTGAVELWDSMNGGAAQLLNVQNLTAGPGGTSVFAMRLKISPGVHTVYAHYRGDTNWQGKNSANVQLSSSTFTLAVTPPTIVVAAEGSGTGTVTITPSGGFTGTVALTCATGTSSLPVGFSCSFAQPSVAISGGTAITTLTLAPTANAAVAVKTTSAIRIRSAMRMISFASSGLLLGLAAFAPKSSRNFARACGFIVVVTLVVYGCGGGTGGGGPFSTTTNLISSNLKAGFGTPVTFNATVTPSGAATPAGTVQLFDSGRPLGGPVRASSGIASFLATSLGVGVHTITAQYSGDMNTLGSISTPIAQEITGQVIVEITGDSNGMTQTADFAVQVN